MAFLFRRAPDALRLPEDERKAVVTWKVRRARALHERVDKKQESGAKGPFLARICIGNPNEIP